MILQGFFLGLHGTIGCFKGWCFWTHAIEVICFSLTAVCFKELWSHPKFCGGAVWRIDTWWASSSGQKITFLMSLTHLKCRESTKYTQFYLPKRLRPENALKMWHFSSKVWTQESGSSSWQCSGALAAWVKGAAIMLVQGSERDLCYVFWLDMWMTLAKSFLSSQK